MTEPVIRFAAAAPGDIERKAATVHINSHPIDSRQKQQEIARLVRTLGLGNLFASPDSDLENFVYAHNIHVWVYRCTQVISRALVRAVPRQYLYTKKGRESLAPDHPASLILERPNKWTTGSQMREKWGVSLSITGMIYQFKYIDHFEYEVNGQQIEYTPEVCVYHKYENPNNDYYGLPPLKAATNAVSQYLAASKWNLHFFKNAAAPLGILTTDYTFRNKKRDQPHCGAMAETVFRL